VPGPASSLVRARAECYAPGSAKNALLLLWRGSLSTERPGRLEHPEHLAEVAGLLMICDLRKFDVSYIFGTISVS
jgi:hypothetical protein